MFVFYKSFFIDPAGLCRHSCSAQGLACSRGRIVVGAGPWAKASLAPGSPGRVPAGGSLSAWAPCSVGFPTKWKLHTRASVLRREGTSSGSWRIHGASPLSHAQSSPGPRAGDGRAWGARKIFPAVSGNHELPQTAAGLRSTPDMSPGALRGRRGVGGSSAPRPTRSTWVWRTASPPGREEGTPLRPSRPWGWCGAGNRPGWKYLKSSRYCPSTLKPSESFWCVIASIPSPPPSMIIP